MSVSKNLAKTEFLKMKASTSMRMGHVGEQKLHENGLFEKENVDINEDSSLVENSAVQKWAASGCHWR